MQSQVFYLVALPLFAATLNQYGPNIACLLSLSHIVNYALPCLGAVVRHDWDNIPEPFSKAAFFAHLYPSANEVLAASILILIICLCYDPVPERFRPGFISLLPASLQPSFADPRMGTCLSAISMGSYHSNSNLTLWPPHTLQETSGAN